MSELAEYARRDFMAIREAINDTPGWQFDGGDVGIEGEHGVWISVNAKHMPCGWIRVCRDMSEWHEELRTHRCVNP